MRLIKSYIFILLAGVLTMTSCEDYFGDINVDPDNPTAVTPNVLLPQIEARLAYVYGGDFSRYLGIYTQHIDGKGRQFAVIQNYNLLPNDVDNIWDNMYSGVLMDNRQMIANAEENGYAHYVAIGKAIEAYTMMLLTDFFGDVPYTDAFQGTGLIQPGFDSQESIYNTIFALISDANKGFDGDNGGFAPGGDDILYGGDVAKWKKFLSVLEARGKLHLAKKDGGNYQAALNALSGGFDSRDDDCRFVFGTGATEAAPWFQYIEQRSDIGIGDGFVALMNSLGDPREATYGLDIQEDYSNPIAQADQDLGLLTYTEAKFIEAECLEATGGDPSAAYMEAIRSSMVDAAITDAATIDAYIASDGVTPAGGIAKNEIMIQKYIAMFTDPESFNDWRRSGIPALTPNAGNEVPRRLPYSQNEILSNSNTPSPADFTIFSRVWWDN